MEGIYSNIDEILIKEGLLSEKDIRAAKEEAGKRGIPVYDALKDLGLVSEEKNGFTDG